jgi:hypothetical protein
LYREIRVVSSNQLIASTLGSPEFTGDQVLTSERDVPRRYFPGVFRPSINAPRANDRLAHGSVVVRAFTFDSLRLNVFNPSNGSAVLYYADAWDPGWRAFVNGVPSPIIRTNLGFKSVIVPSGRSEVRFVFGDLRSRLWAEAATILSLFVIGGIVSLVLLDMRNCTIGVRTR